MSLQTGVRRTVLVLLALLFATAVDAQDAKERHEEALRKLEELNAQITVRPEDNGDGTLIVATDGAWTGGDEGLDLLKDLQGLYKLRLGGRITDAGMARVAELTQLKSLDVHVTDITDAGVVHLKKLTRLERLNLTYTKVSDAGVRHLAGLKQLDWLGLAYTRVTMQGAAQLREDLPDTIIEGNFRR